MFDFIFTDFTSFVFWQKVFNFMRWVFIFIDIGLFVGIIYILKRSLEYCPPFVSHKHVPYLKGIAIPKPSANAVFMKSEWNAFLARASAAQDESLPLLIIEADKLVDEALKKLGFPGETMLERIQALARTRKMHTLEGFWRAHKVRNEIVHAPNYSVSRQDVEHYLQIYQRFLKELGCI